MDTDGVDRKEKERAHLRSSVGLSLNYPRAGVSAASPPPPEWKRTREVRTVPGGPRTFDSLAGSVHALEPYRRAGLDIVCLDVQHSMQIFQVVSGPFRGLYRVVEVIDEVLTQGIAIGTGEGNLTVAEHRVVLDFDESARSIRVGVTSVWKPSPRFVLPGGSGREELRWRRFVQKVADGVGDAGR